MRTFIVAQYLLLGVFLLSSCYENYIDDSKESYIDQNATVPVPNDSDAIDLGLSVKWANHNVGATKPEGYGNYYAWGEVDPKKQYDKSTYVGVDLWDYFDVAQIKWGKKWRIPTIAEIYELRDSCTYKETTLNGVKGMQFTGKNGNSIFLPAAGFCSGKRFFDVGTEGHYRQSSISYGTHNDDVPYYKSYSYYDGLTIRPVYVE